MSFHEKKQEFSFGSNLSTPQNNFYNSSLFATTGAIANGVHTQVLSSTSSSPISSAASSPILDAARHTVKKKKRYKKKGSTTHIDYNMISRQFCQYYYTNVDAKNSEIVKLYKNFSGMNFNGEEYKGESIVGKYKQIYSNNTKHIIQQIQAVPDGSRRINVMVIGDVRVNDQQRKFTQYFHLCWLGDESYWLKDTIFSFI